MVRRHGDHCPGGHSSGVGDAVIAPKCPLKDNKMRPRIAETAKTLWLIYVLLTVARALALWFAGMPAMPFAIGAQLRRSPLAVSHPRCQRGYQNSRQSFHYCHFPADPGCNLVCNYLSAAQPEVVLARPGFRMFTDQAALVDHLYAGAVRHDVYNSADDAESGVLPGGFDGDNGLYHRQHCAWPLFLPVRAVLGIYRRLCRSGGGLKVFRICCCSSGRDWLRCHRTRFTALN
jgi:trk system potassium uptake protein TrkH